VTLKKLGRYELLRVLGKGAMGVVYEGRDPNLDRRVAIKTVKVENLSEEAAAEYEHRFRTEARSAARLQHPNIVSVYDSDRDGDVAFLVMEYIQGDDLKHHLDRGVRYSLEQSLKMIRDLLSALDYAHKQGIVHRDIKPANLLLEPGGRVKLTDFGVARIQDSGEATRTQGSMIGTLKYMAPEQVQGQKIDSRADLFSVGVVLYQLLTDQRPFDGDNDFSIIHAIIGHEPPVPSTVNPRLPAALDAVVARALAKTRDERFATARDFAVALQAAIRRAEDQTVIPPPNPLKKMEPALSRPLTTPGSLPPGTVPGGVTAPSAGSVTSVTQELELVYWKDVKDSTDPEDLLGFLEKFPTGIYADLARRRLRKLAGAEGTTNITAVDSAGGSGSGSGSGKASAGGSTLGGNGTSTMFPDYDATRAQSEMAPGGKAAGTGLRPSDWVDQEYTSTRVEGDFAATVAEPRPGEMPAAATAPEEEAAAALRPARKKPPMAVLAGIGALAAAGIVLAMVMGRGGDKSATLADAQPAASAPAARASRAAPVPAPADVPAPTVVVIAPRAAAPQAAPVTSSPPPPAEAMVLAPTPTPAPAATEAAPRPRAKASQPRASNRNVPTIAPEPPPRTAAMGALPRVEPEPPRGVPPPVLAAANSNYQAVDQCRDRMFLAKEICLADHCEKAGARGHPLCVKRREEIRMREESRANRGPQQAP
jgi:serine/threonine-protein kinase